ncbi:MAG: 8-oxo-dGTP diphosphatase [Lachnospiraceae bacterium]|nr:8-oxo-dGTP diphosphatase [Lachnospiraceae bacterium]
MERTEKVELTVLCLVYNEDAYLLQDRVKEDWKGYTLPGGHIESGESIVHAIVREMKEETGLTILNPKLCGVKQFPIEDGRYIVFLFRTDKYEGELISSEEGNMHWVKKKELSNVNLVSDFNELLQVILDDNLNEFQYIIEGDQWKVVLK